MTGNGDDSILKDGLLGWKEIFLRNTFYKRAFVLHLASLVLLRLIVTKRYPTLSPFAILASLLCDFLFSFPIKDITSIEFDGKVISLSNICSKNIYSALRAHEVVSLEKSIKAISVDLL